MPHVISDRDFSKLIEAHAGKPTMEDVYTKLAEAETDIQTGMVSDANQELCGWHGIQAKGLQLYC